MKSFWKGWTVGRPQLSVGELARGSLSVRIGDFPGEEGKLIPIPHEYLEIDLNVELKDLFGVLPDGYEVVKEEWSDGHTNRIDEPGKEIVLIKDGAPTVGDSRSIALWLGVVCQKIGTGNPRDYPGYWLAGPWNVWEVIYIEIPLTR